jgi:hypothetical protein
MRSAPALSELPLRAAGVACLRYRPICERFVHDCSCGREFFGQNVARLLRAHHKDALVFDASLFLEFAHHPFCDEFFRLKIDVQVKILNALRRGGPIAAMRTPPISRASS